MPAADLNIPGFYGKLPTAGDFVARRVAPEVVQPLDRWLARHLAPLIGTERWDEHTALRFLSGTAAFGQAAGIIVASRDRVGRRFPLTIMAGLDLASIALVRAEAWFQRIETLALAAQAGEFSPDELEGALVDLPLSTPDTDDEIIDGLLMWSDESDLFDIDPENPGEPLVHLLSPSRETS